LNVGKVATAQKSRSDNALLPQSWSYYSKSFPVARPKATPGKTIEPIVVASEEGVQQEDDLDPDKDEEANPLVQESVNMIELWRIFK
jgi:hypothetical protein